MADGGAHACPFFDARGYPCELDDGHVGEHQRTQQARIIRWPRYLDEVPGLADRFKFECDICGDLRTAEQLVNLDLLYFCCCTPGHQDYEQWIRGQTLRGSLLPYLTSGELERGQQSEEQLAQPTAASIFALVDVGPEEFAMWWASPTSLLSGGVPSELVAVDPVRVLRAVTCVAHVIADGRDNMPLADHR